MSTQQVTSRSRLALTLFLGLAALAVLVGLGTWQVQRLHWKEALLATIAERVASAPRPLAEIEQQFAASADVDYQPVTASGAYLHSAERHFFATWQGQTGYYVYTPLLLADAGTESNFVFVNRGFVPYELKAADKRAAGQVAGQVQVTGLARNPLVAKPSYLVPDNDPAKNIFYWKDRDTFAATAGLPAGAKVLPFFIDANNAPNPGGLPVGGVTMIDLPNSHLQYAVTWFGLAAALVGVMGVWLWRNRLSR